MIATLNNAPKLQAEHARSQPGPLSVAHTLHSPDPVDLTAIFSPPVQLAIWNRPIDPMITTYLDVNCDRLGSGMRGWCDAGRLPDVSGLPAALGRDVLAQDIALLAEMLAELVDCERVGVRLEVISRAMCPRLHVDRVGIRLLCTYRGPGTQWIDDEGADRSRLGAGAGGLPDEASGLFGPATQVREVAPFAVALLKGSHWQGNAQRGVIHRSPAVEEADFPRVLVAMDPQW